jgi:predicted nucleotidyltransferase
MSTPRIPIPLPEIEAFCKKWKITEFSLFGSVLRDDFGPDSDVDVLVEFEEGVVWGLLEFGRMEDELQTLFGRDVDFIQKKSIERSRNYIRRHGILSNTHAIYPS